MRIPNRILWVILTIAIGESFALTSIGVPTYTDVATYAIDKYPAYTQIPPNNPNCLNCGVNFSTSHFFYDRLKLKLKQKYPTVSCTHRIAKYDSEVTMDALTSTESDDQEFVLISSQGLPQRIVAYNGIVENNHYQSFYSFATNGAKELSPKRFGGWTRWVIFDAPRVLQSGDDDNGGFTNYHEWLGGAHALLGHRGDNNKFFSVYEKINGTTYVNWSFVQFDEFLENFIIREQDVWTSYKNAIEYWQYTRANKSVEPAIVYQSGLTDNNQPIDFSAEKYKTTYNGPFDVAHRARPKPLSIKWATFGKPVY